MSKNVSKSLDWQQVVPLVCAVYNFLPNENSKESLFFLMFSRDPTVSLNSLLKPMVRYTDTDKNIVSLEALKNMYQLVETNLKLAKRKRILHIDKVNRG